MSALEVRDVSPFHGALLMSNLDKRQRQIFIIFNFFFLKSNVKSWTIEETGREKSRAFKN